MPKNNKKEEEIKNTMTTPQPTSTHDPVKKVEDIGSKSSNTPEPEKKEPTVELKKSDFDRLMETLDRNAKDISLLYKASDKSRMAKAMGNGGEILIRKVNIWTWDDTGKIILATKLLTNKSEIVLGRWVEDQTVEVFIEDSTSFVVPILEFYRKTLHKLPAEILATTKSRDEYNQESTLFKVQLPSGRTLEINSKFVN